MNLFQAPRPAQRTAHSLRTGDGHPGRDVRTGTHVNSRIFSKAGVGERDVLQLSYFAAAVQYNMRPAAAAGMHAAI